MSDEESPLKPPPSQAIEPRRRIITTRGRPRNNNDVITLESWIQSCRLDQDKTGPCTAYALVHKPLDKELHTVTLGGSPGRTDGELAKLFLGVAQSYADGLPGMQQFELLAFYSKDEPEAFRPFMLSGRTEYEGGATEAPDKTGMTAQSMRLTEILVQGSFRSQESMAKIMRETMQDIGAENRSLRQENMGMFDILKNLLVEREKMAHNRQMEEAQYARATAERAAWLKMAPPLVNSIVGKEVFPQSSADTALITAAVEHMSPEQLQMLSGILPPEVWGPLATRMQQILEEKEKLKLQVQEIAKLSAPIEADDPQAGEV
jgi:hypothetical protein